MEGVGGRERGWQRKGERIEEKYDGRGGKTRG